jgi:subtilase family serine protease
VRSVPTLAPNVVSSGSATVTIATTTTAGSYFLLACADDTNVSIESNETNNCVASASAVAIAP